MGQGEMGISLDTNRADLLSSVNGFMMSQAPVQTLTLPAIVRAAVPRGRVFFGWWYGGLSEGALVA